MSKHVFRSLRTREFAVSLSNRIFEVKQHRAGHECDFAFRVESTTP